MSDGQGGAFTFESEMVRRLETLTKQLEGLQARVESTYVRFDLFEANKQLQETERTVLSDRIEKLESRSEWLIRVVGALIIAAVIGLVIGTGAGR